MPVPPPTPFTDLREHLHNAGIDAAYLSLILEQYLTKADNMPKQDWMSDVQDDHQAWTYREAINQFRQMIADKPDTGNGEQDEALSQED